MFLKSSQAKSTRFIPQFDLAVVCTGGNEFVLIEMNGLGLVNEAFLVDDITLRFPLPYDDLTECFESQTNPCSRSVDSHCTDLVFTN